MKKDKWKKWDFDWSRKYTCKFNKKFYKWYRKIQKEVFNGKHWDNLK